ncbi:MAG: ATP-binding cassette domain-containing protein [Sporolactobacillus sp.]|jgi:D-methionine transport system ATP-binding protein|nr:ATP-binding cassette domain-containing protein [Sporolactobacillus sp.]
MIEFRHVSKVFTTGKVKIQALDDVSLTIRKGEIFGVIGYSGAGKSTLIRCVNLLEQPTSGEVIIAGTNVRTLTQRDLRRLRRKIGMIFQGYNLLETATVYDNVAIPLKLEGVNKKLIKERTEKYLGIVGLSDRARAYPSQLSGGQKQRVAIARALAHEPEVLLSDEATSALDPNTTDAILDLLLEVNRELGITIFLITHQLNVIQRICDRVAVMEKGQIIEQGTVVDVFSKPRAPLTRQFVRNASRVKIPQQLRRELLARGKLFVLTFLGESSTEPALATLARRFDVLPSIIAGGIDQLKDQSIGTLVVHLQGNREELDHAVSFLQSKHILVKEVTSER